MFNSDEKEPELWAPAGPPPQEHFAPPLSRKTSQVSFEQMISSGCVGYRRSFQQVPKADMQELPRAQYQPAIIQTRVGIILYPSPGTIELCTITG